jgi:lysophospholipid acyltransferase (LPLAT)-like uncharacterized protein
MPSLRDYYKTKGEPWNSMRSWVMPQFLRLGHSTLTSTYRISTSGFQRSHRLWEEPQGNGVLLVGWHDQLLVIMHLLRNQDCAAIMSRSRSGQMNAKLWNLYGWSTVWGSTRKREGISALREVLRQLRTGRSFGISPDGPKGPRHQAEAGVVFLASNAPAQVVPLGVAAHSAWRLPTWDRYLIPKPFTRVHMHIGPPLTVPPHIPRDEMPRWQRFIDQAIDRAEAEAERHVEVKGKR